MINMAFIRTKTINGNKYIYLDARKKVNGEVKTKFSKYIGPAGDASVDDVPEEYRDEVSEEDLGTTEKENEEPKGMKNYIKENKDIVLESSLENVDLDSKKKIKQKFKEVVEKNGKEYDEIIIDEEDNKVKAIKKTYSINTYPEDFEGISSKKYNVDRADKINKITEKGILYTNEAKRGKRGEPQQFIITKKKDGEETKQYKVYNYKDEGKKVFVDDEKTDIERVL